MSNEVAFRRIGAGFCGTVWAMKPENFPEQVHAFKLEDGDPGRSFQKEFKMHNAALNAMEQYEQLNSVHSLYVSIPECHQLITPENDSWWNENLRKFPVNYAPCNTPHSDRIPPVC